MKLYRFTAIDSQRAMAAIWQKFGTEALIYSTRNIPEGVEVIAGCDAGDENNQPIEIIVENQGINNASDDKLNIQLQVMEENIVMLSNYVAMLHRIFVEKNTKKKWKKFNFSFLTKWIRTKKTNLEAGYEHQATQ